MPFVQDIKRSLVQRPPGTSVSSILDRTLIFNELEALESAVPFIQRSAGITEIKVVELNVGSDGKFEARMKNGDKVEPLVAIEKTVPGFPSLAFENI